MTLNNHPHRGIDGGGFRMTTMTRPIVTHTAYDGTITYKKGSEVIAYEGLAGFIAHISLTQGWKAYGSPSYASGNFIAIRSPYTPEDLPIDPGVDGWIRMTVDELLDFADAESAVG